MEQPTTVGDALTLRRQQVREYRCEAERARRRVAAQREQHEDLVATAAG